MSAHPVTAPAEALFALCAERLRAPTNVTGDPATGAITFYFTPDLTAAERATLADLQAVATSRILDPEDWTKIRAELPTFVAFMAAASPTGAQTAAAVKSVIRVLRAIVRN